MRINAAHAHMIKPRGGERDVIDGAARIVRICEAAGKSAWTPAGTAHLAGGARVRYCRLLYRPHIAGLLSAVVSQLALSLHVIGLVYLHVAQGEPPACRFAK